MDTEELFSGVMHPGFTVAGRYGFLANETAATLTPLVVRMAAEIDQLRKRIAELEAPDPLGEALNTGDGTDRP